MPTQKRVNIAHRDGREYSIEPDDFTNTRVHPEGVGSYADQGFAIVNHVDGTPYEGPKTKREIEQAAEGRTSTRQERAAAKPKASAPRRPRSRRAAPSKPADAPPPAETASDAAPSDGADRAETASEPKGA